MLICTTSNGSVYLDVIKNTVRKVFISNVKYKKELNFLQHVQHIDTVIKIISFNNEASYIELEYVPHQLDEIIIQKKLNDTQKHKIIYHLSMFMVDIHELGIVHNDLKGKNILVYDDLETIKVIDFDLAEWKSDPLSDIEKFRFIVIQIMFNISYKASIKQYGKCLAKLSTKFQGLLVLVDVYEICNTIKEMM